MNLIELLEETTGRYPQKPALIDGSNVLSYAGLAEQVSAWASRLQTLRLAPGARIGLCYPNSIRYVALTFALWKVGAVVVPVPIECTPEDLIELSGTMELHGVLGQNASEKSVELEHECHFIPLRSSALLPARPAHGKAWFFVTRRCATA
jgi:long-chain acyl-CoA synthetase